MQLPDGIVDSHQLAMGGDALGQAGYTQARIQLQPLGGKAGGGWQIADILFGWLGRCAVRRRFPVAQIIADIQLFIITRVETVIRRRVLQPLGRLIRYR